MIITDQWRDMVRIIEDELQLDENPSAARLAYESRAYQRYKAAITAHRNDPSTKNEKRLVTTTRNYVAYLNIIEETFKFRDPDAWAADEREKALCGNYEEGRI